MRLKEVDSKRFAEMCGRVVKHFKGNEYLVLDIAEHTETGKPLVVYRALYGINRLYVRPLEMFMSEVDKEKYPSSKQKYRFELKD